MWRVTAKSAGVGDEVGVGAEAGVGEEAGECEQQQQRKQLLWLQLPSVVGAVVFLEFN